MLQPGGSGSAGREAGQQGLGPLGIMAQYHCAVDKLFEVPEAFDPQPKVQSAIVRLAPPPVAPPACDTGLLRQVQAAFAQRRKTLRNNLKGL